MEDRRKTLRRAKTGRRARMRSAHVVYAVPALPPALEPLRFLARNLYWAWNRDIRALFQDLDPEEWEATHRNPVLMLGRVSGERLRELGLDNEYLGRLDRAAATLKAELSRETWYQREHGDRENPGPIAYFSMEFGLCECLPQYSGGLGVLAGDHLKSASDQGIPLVGVGLLYQQGYFTQSLSPDGTQIEHSSENDFQNLPIAPVTNPDGSPFHVQVELPGRQVRVHVWRADVGRIALFLLDTRVEGNSREDQEITKALYSGGKPMRIKQEIVLGVGGIRVLEGLGLRPAACHMNEGHAAFLALERARLAMVHHHLTFAQALEATSGSNIFTTHTPVPAGIDVFSPDLVAEHLGPYAETMGFSMDVFLSLGRAKPSDQSEHFNMARLAFLFSGQRNGVARLHGEVSRKMWQHLWPEIPVDEIPVGSVTNGVHTGTWVSPQMARLFARHLGDDWWRGEHESAHWERITHVPLEEIWAVRGERRRMLVDFARERLFEQLTARGLSRRERDHARTVLDPDALTIGFARRFATYKRATLLLGDLDRLARLVGDEQRPVQLLFAGKAHPQDQEGKELIRQIVEAGRDPRLRDHLVFIEDYDIRVAKYMVRGVDVWLNNPRRPLEASGTSGMKAAINGALHCSTLDGWWDEAYHPDIGWAIGDREEYEDEEYQDRMEYEALMHTLGERIVPMFYDRGRDGLPREWLERVARCIAAVAPRFSAQRMVREYARDYYLPALDRYLSMVVHDVSRCRQLAEWKHHVREAWYDLAIEQVHDDARGPVPTGARTTVEAVLRLGALQPGDVSVEIFHGLLDTSGCIVDADVTEMTAGEELPEGRIRYKGAFTLTHAGQTGYLVRVRPRHELLHSENELGLIAWE